jgi:hypothetical protein
MNTHTHMDTTYKILRKFFNGHDEIVIATGLTLEEARAHCKDPDTSSRTCTTEEGMNLTRDKGPWFDGYEEE